MEQKMIPSFLPSFLLVGLGFELMASSSQNSQKFGFLTLLK
jgi:hypothetical protein